ncbi:MAG: S8 family serine peptidase, partial [Cyclobacteriaceae bacterium]|nr:S8 family serine peptidase [Cyclobacteriaceae bacterium]
MKSNNYQQSLSYYFGLGLILLLFVGTESFAQFRTIERAETMKKPVLYNGKAASSQGHYDGVIRIKMRPEATAQLDRMLLERASAKGEVIARSSDTHVVTGMTQLDAVHQGCEAKVMKRVFRPAGKFEEKHRKHGLHLWYEVQYDDPRAIEQILRDYRGVAEVAIAEKVHEKAHVGYEVSGVYEAEEVLTDPPNDTFFDLNQYSFNNTGQNIQGQVGTVGADVSMFEAWAIETGSSDIVVAVTDGGIQVDHEDLVGNMWVNVDEIPGNGIDDDNNGYVDDINGYGFGDDTGSIPADIHGSHVGGTIAAETNNAIGVAGIAGGEGTDDGVRLMSLAAFGETGTMGFEDTYTYGADNGAVVSQNSWGYTVAGAFDQVVLDGIDYFIAEAGTDALGNPFGPMQGGIVIFAAGNDNADGQ